MRLTAEGIHVHTSHVHAAQATALLAKELFQDYRFEDRFDDGTFKINLSILIDCLNIFGSPSTLNSTVGPPVQMAYRRLGENLFLMLEENATTLTDVGLRTLEPDALPAWKFEATPNTNEIIVHASCLHDILGELDAASTEHVQLLLSPDAPQFRITTQGATGSSVVEFARTSEALVDFRVTHAQENQYRLRLLQPAIKALPLASKVHIRINEVGVLLLALHLPPCGDGVASYVHFTLQPVVDGDDAMAS
jgi:cell cycle checkpoint protein